MFMIMIALMFDTAPPVPILRHTINPDRWQVETSYVCSDGKRSFTIRYDGSQQKVSFVGGTRLGVRLRSSAAAAATKALRQLDAVSGIYPQCGAGYDTLLVSGLLGRQRALTHLVWKGSGFETSEPMMISGP